MATRQEYDAVIKEAEGKEQEAADLRQKADQLNEDAKPFIAAAQAAATAKHAAAADAQRIEGKIETLRTSLNAKVAEQKALVAGQQAEVQQQTGIMLNSFAQSNHRQEAGLINRLDDVGDPITGQRLPVEDVLESLFGLHREAPLTADEYDGNALTAAGYDVYRLNASDYAVVGKALLV